MTRMRLPCYPSGLGALIYDAILPSMENVYCPAETGSTYYLIKAARLKGTPQYSAPGFKYAVDHCADSSSPTKIEAKSSYCVRTMHWKRNAEYPALMFGTPLNQQDQYLYSTEKGALGRTPGACIMTDTFVQVSPTAPQTNFIEDFHRVGLNAGYGDGHVEWIEDRNNQIKNLGTAWTSYVQDMRTITEDVWDAFDGDIGYHPGYFYVEGLKK